MIVSAFDYLLCRCLLPPDSVHWELWLKAVINFRTKSQFSLDKINSGVSTRSRPRQSFSQRVLLDISCGEILRGL